MTCKLAKKTKRVKISLNINVSSKVQDLRIFTHSMSLTLVYFSSILAMKLIFLQNTSIIMQNTLVKIPCHLKRQNSYFLLHRVQSLCNYTTAVYNNINK